MYGGSSFINRFGKFYNNSNRADETQNWLTFELDPAAGVIFWRTLFWQVRSHDRGVVVV